MKRVVNFILILFLLLGLVFFLLLRLEGYFFTPSVSGSRILTICSTQFLEDLDLIYELKEWILKP